MDLCTTKLLLGLVLTKSALEYGGPGDEYLGGVANHQSKMGRDKTCCRQAGNCSKCRRDHRDTGHGLCDGGEAGTGVDGIARGGLGHTADIA